VEVVFQTDQFGRVTCELADGQTNAVVTASDRPEAVAALADALDALAANGIGECFWHEAAGEYRWVFRRNGESVRIAVMWSSGTLSGWEHVFWTGCDMASFAADIMNGLNTVNSGC
jgi:hypothetical protein